ncbi:MAG: Topoisomerase 1-associated factor 1 [Piccolia ochrophora]|nr:MAG: Topoisomerase 1-associated factor 1 [Piccolia ochrophora]
MEELPASFTAAQETVDPEVRAYVNSLVSALGGSGADEDGRYVLGDDALACLKDLKRWLKLYDEKLNRLDVARCLAEANLVNGDLLQILASWPEDATEDRVRSKIALACLELLVPLTWPIDKTDLQMTVNHHRHMPYLRQAQVIYKRSILNHDTAKLLRTSVRVALPSMALPLSERSSRDEGIIKILLYFLRNIAMISVRPNARNDETDNDVNRSSTIDAFHYQDIFQVLLTVSSGMGEEFNTQDVVVLEALFYLLKGINIERLFLDDDQLDTKKTNELQALLNKEAGMLRGYARNAPTRHNRFGTMIWVKRDDNRYSTVSGQDILLDEQKTLDKIDQTKTWKKPSGKRKPVEQPQEDFDMPVALTPSATRHLRAFVEEFLDSGFNPLFHHVQKAIQREADRVLDTHMRQFFFLISWFLQAERARHKADRDRRNTDTENENADVEDFSSVGSVLTQEIFIMLNRFMQESQDIKEWRDLNAGMRCFTQILLTVQDMAESPIEEDQVIAENIQNRIFYEETTHDRIISIVRGYSNQGFGYLDACTELAHVHLRMLEHYSKQNVEMQVRSKRKARRRKKQKDSGQDAEGHDDDDEGSEREEVAQAQQTSRERKFDFKRFAAKFMTQPCVDTFVQLTKYYQDLTSDQLKRAHRFFYRVAFKMDSTIMLFRVDIIALLKKVVKGPEGLDMLGPTYKDWEELVKQIVKKLVKKMQERPQLAIEMLFSKIPATVHYLEYGHEKQTTTTRPRAPAELEVKPGMDKAGQIAVAVSVLLDQSKFDEVNWMKQVLESAIKERQSWEDAATALRSIETEGEPPEDLEKAAPVERGNAPSICKVTSPKELRAMTDFGLVVKPDNEARRVFLFKDNKLRLLLMIVGFQSLGIEDTSEATWIIPASCSAQDLQTSLDTIKRTEFDPPVYDDGKLAEDFVRRKSAARPRRATYDDESDNEGIIDDEEDFLFPDTQRSTNRADAIKDLKTKRRRRQQGSAEPLNDEELEARAKAREVANLEKRRKIKSALFIHESDEESDNERDQDFLAKEEERRRAYDRRVLETLRQGQAAPSDAQNKKRKGSALHADGEKRIKSTRVVDESGDENLMSINSSPSRSESAMLRETESENTDTPPSSPHLLSSGFNDAARSKSGLTRTPSPSPLAKGVGPMVAPMELSDEEDDEIPVVNTKRRIRAGFVIDSDSE